MNRVEADRRAAKLADLLHRESVGIENIVRLLNYDIEDYTFIFVADRHGSRGGTIQRVADDDHGFRPNTDVWQFK